MFLLFKNNIVGRVAIHMESYPTFLFLVGHPSEARTTLDNKSLTSWSSHFSWFLERGGGTPLQQIDRSFIVEWSAVFTEKGVNSAQIE